MSAKNRNEKVGNRKLHLTLESLCIIKNYNALLRGKNKTTFTFMSFSLFPCLIMRLIFSKKELELNFKLGIRVTKIVWICIL